MTTRIRNVHIDNYIDAVRNGEILVSQDVAALIELVEKKLTQENVWIDENAINEAIESIETKAENYIAHAVKVGIFQASHLKNLQNGTMTTDRLLGLHITIQQRRDNKK